MRKIMSIAFVALFTLTMSAGVVSADPGSSDPPSTSGGSQGKGATTDKFRVSYFNPIGGNWDCTGVRVVNRNHTKDSFECTITDLVSLPPGTYTRTSNSWNGGWISDYDPPIRASSFTLVVSDNGDGTGDVQGDAYYQ